MPTKDLIFKLIGQDASASAALEKVGKNAGKAGGALKGMGVVGAGAFSAIAASAVAGKVIGFAKESLNAYSEVAGETVKLQRYLGGTAEQSSRLASALHMTGIDTDMAAKSLGIMSKFTSTAGSQLNDYDSKLADAAQHHKVFKGHLGAAAAAFTELGIHILDAQGRTRDSTGVLMDFADQISKMPAGVDRTTMVLKAFGKGGMAMLPFLTRGREGIKDLMKESDKMGTTLSGSDLKAVKANTMAKREFGEALKGIQVSIGRYLYPAMTKLIQFVNAHVIPVFRAATKWVHDHSAMLKGLASVLVPVILTIKTISIVTKLWAAAQTLLTIAMDANPIGIIIVAIAALAAGLIYAYKHSETFRNIVQGVFRAVGGAIKGFIGVFRGIIHIVGEVIGWIRHHWQLVIAMITGPIGLAVFFVVKHFNTIKSIVLGVIGWIRHAFESYIGFVLGLPARVWRGLVHLWDIIPHAFKAAINMVIGWWDGLSFKMPKIHIPGTNINVGGMTIRTPQIPKLAAGGIVSSPTLALIGESGPEAVVPLRRGGLGGGLTVNVHNAVIGSSDQAARAIYAHLLELKRRGFDMSALGLAP